MNSGKTVSALAAAMVIALTAGLSEGYTGLITRTICGAGGRFDSPNMSVFYCPLNADGQLATPKYVKFPQPVERRVSSTTIATRVNAKGVHDWQRGRVCVRALVDNPVLRIVAASSNLVCTAGVNFTSANLNPSALTLPIDGFAYASVSMQKGNTDLTELPAVNVVSWTFEARSN